MNMIFSWNKQNSNYHLIKHLLFKSFIRPWTCIFICLGRSSEEKVTQGHLDPWILEPIFLLWHCLSTWVQRLVYQGLQVNVSVSSFWNIALSWMYAVTDWDFIYVLLVPSLQWLDLTCGLSHWLGSYSFRDGFMATNHLLVTVQTSTAGPTHHRSSWVEFT